MKSTRDDTPAPGKSTSRPAVSRRTDPLYFFPDSEVTDQELRKILSEEDHERRCWAVSHLLRYAQWEDIWSYVTRDEVREIFLDLDLPENLQTAWARMLKLEARVG